jgi:hypothetical protein
MLRNFLAFKANKNIGAALYSSLITDKATLGQGNRNGNTPRLSSLSISDTLLNLPQH